MGTVRSPSPIVEAFVRSVNERLPAEQSEKLGSFQDDVARTIDAQDGHRARHCALWAIRTAGDRALSHPEWQRIKETHEVWKNAWFGVEFGRMTKTAGRRQPIEDVEIEWVEDAIRVANLVGSAIGWEHARWDQLLAELIAMEPEIAPA